MKNFLENHFHIKESGSTVGTELLAGVVTFCTMAYILIVQASMMVAAGMNGAGVMLATALISGLATLAMGIYAKSPFALAPGIN